MASPADVQPGFFVRVKVAGGITLYSKRTDKRGAERLGDDFERSVANAPDGWGFIIFPARSGDVRVRADRVTTIEVSRADDGRPAPPLVPGLEHPVAGAGLERR